MMTVDPDGLEQWARYHDYRISLLGCHPNWRSLKFKM